jgi:hypothetical protein
VKVKKNGWRNPSEILELDLRMAEFEKSPKSITFPRQFVILLLLPFFITLFFSSGIA